MSKKSEANKRQVGGEHYKGSYQHWDFVIDTRQNYIQGCASKYVSRWRGKSGVQDLEKALHYCQKGLEAFPTPAFSTAGQQVKLVEFIKSQDLTDQEGYILFDIMECRWADAISAVEKMLRTNGFND